MSSTITRTTPTASVPPEQAPLLWEAGTKPRMLLIVNPRATTVSGRLKNLVIYALRGRYEVEFVETEGQNHATNLAREAARREFDLVVSFAGDGTLNEAANGLAGSGVPLSILPGGSTNVVCRMLGIPTDVVDATEHLLHVADHPSPRRIDLGSVNGRYFLFSSGVGLDAEAVRWVDARNGVKARRAYLWFAYAGTTRYLRNYRKRPPQLVVDVDGERVQGISAVVQNSDPYTYFRERPLAVCEEVSLDSGSMSLAVLRRGLDRDAIAAAWRLFTPARISRHSQVASFTRVESARIEPVPGLCEALPVQVDGDYIGDHEMLTYETHPAALTVLA